MYPSDCPNELGGKEGLRSMGAGAVGASRLGDGSANQRETFKGTVRMCRVPMDQVEAHKLFSAGAGWVWLTVKMLLKYWFDIGWRMKTPRDRRQVLGQGMVATLRYAMQQQHIPQIGRAHV